MQIQSHCNMSHRRRPFAVMMVEKYAPASKLYREIKTKRQVPPGINFFECYYHSDHVDSRARTRLLNIYTNLNLGSLVSEFCFPRS
jgi:hypothetical protein